MPRRITRENILSGEVRRHAMAQASDGTKFLSDEERRVILERMLSCKISNAPLWVFGYGSLMWNPAIHYVNRQPGKIYGYHRRFCLWSTLGRGSPAKPGLMLALDRGGCCNGIAYKIGATAAVTELDILFRRELLTFAYRPTWTRLHINSKEVVNAITFVIDPHHDRYAGDLSEARTVQLISESAGSLGRCSDYLFDTLGSLEAERISDRRMARLGQLVKRYQTTHRIA